MTGRATGSTSNMPPTRVTGAAAGVGRDTANVLADDGHDVVVHVRNPARLADGEDTGRWKGVVTGDLADLDEIRDVARQGGAGGRPATPTYPPPPPHHPRPGAG